MSEPNDDTPPNTRPTEDQAALDCLAKNLRVLRAEHDIAQDALAREAGVEKSHLSKMERGRHNPSVLTLLKLSRALGVPVNRILDGVE